MALAKIVDHAEQAEALLIDQYKAKPRLLAWLLSYIKEVQAWDDAIWDVLILRLIDYASDVQLDTIGRLVGEPRKSHSDTLYRLFITARIKVNRSNGYASDVLEVLALLEPATARTFDELQPATMFFEFAEPTEQEPTELSEMLRDTKGGGIGLVLVVPTTAGTDTFQFSDEADVSDAHHGVGDEASPDGEGLLSDVLT